MIPTEYEQFERVVTVGTANFSPVWGDAKRTLAKIEANVVEAAAQGVDVLAFPEEALVGATTCDACRAEAGPCDLHVEEAQTVPGPATDHVVDLAREHDLYVIFGLPERDAHKARRLQLGRGDRPRGAPGRVPQDPPRFPAVGDRGDGVPPGTSLPVFPTRYGPIGVQICYDFWFNPELTRILALKGARVIVNCCSTFKGPGKVDYMRQTTSVRAQENLVYTASANAVGGPGRENYAADALDGPLPADYLGHSLIAGPAFPRFSQVYAEAGETEEIVSASLSFEKLHRWQTVFPMRDWRAGHQLHASQLVADEFRARRTAMTRQRAAARGFVGAQHLEETVDGTVELLELHARQRFEQALPGHEVALVHARRGAEPDGRQPDEHLPAVARVGRAPHEAELLQPVEDLGHATGRAQDDLAELGRRHLVRRARELQQTHHRVVDEAEVEGIEAPVLERVDEQRDAREPREQADGPGLGQVPRLDVHQRAGGPATVTRCITRRSV